MNQPNISNILKDEKSGITYNVMAYKMSETVALHCETYNKTLLKQEGNKKYLIEKVHRQIDRKIRTGEWENVVTK